MTVNACQWKFNDDKTYTKLQDIMLQTYETVSIRHMVGRFSPNVVNPVALWVIEDAYMSGKM